MPRGITSKQCQNMGSYENWMCSCGYEMTAVDPKKCSILKKLHKKKCSGEKLFTRNEMKAHNLKKTKQKRNEICGGENNGGAKQITSYGDVDGVPQPTETYYNLDEYKKTFTSNLFTKKVLKTEKIVEKGDAK